MELDKDLRSRQEARDLACKAEAAAGKLAGLGQEGLDRIVKAIAEAGMAHARELAELACRTGLGVRGMENQIRQLVDDAIFDDCRRRSFEF